MGGENGENGKRYSEQQQILGSEKSESIEQTQPGAVSTGASSRIPVLVKGAYEVEGRPRDLGDTGEDIQSRGKTESEDCIKGMLVGGVSSTGTPHFLLRNQAWSLKPQCILPQLLSTVTKLFIFNFFFTFYLL